MDGNTAKQLKLQLIKKSSDIEQRSLSNSKPTRAEDISVQTEYIDIAQSLEQLGRDTSLAEQDRREWMAIQRALNKLSTGSFGQCEECQEEIPIKRLMALPEARYCAQCQAKQERNQSRSRASGIGFAS